ncbi:hypothetical protein BT67DRAFT_439372 [Trichocladium antarcticum]|uniref:Transcription factor domain-containing protein n=1 Tax=Trichocladium antarcticum TaxID=1450529 RepID=A0AAN6ZG84_9PEZI|nr:hypothetical protein BT67DRAFT_439372 [Trichocladium antarcticum]
MAECMGLDRDGSAYGLRPLETEIRRLVWHQLCFLDIRTCEAQGPKPAIRREEYDTQLPTNCEEEDLAADSTAAPAPATKWTPMLLSIIRFEINEMMRTVWADRRKLEMHKTTLTTMLAKIEHFRKTMYEKYNHLFDRRDPIQHYAYLVMDLLLYRLHAMVLHPFHANTTNPLPDKLSGLLVLSGISIIGTAIKLESGAMFRDWAWYLGAYQQYQIALLLATEVYYRPHAREAQKIWPCLDWVFHLDPNQPRAEKSVEVLADIMAKTDYYMGMRRVRAPTATTQAVPDKLAVKEASPPPRPSPQHTRPTPTTQQQPQQIPQQQQQQQQQLLPPQHMSPPPRMPSLAAPQQQQQQQQQHQQQMRLPQQFNPAALFSGGTMPRPGEGLYNSPGASSDGGGGGSRQLQFVGMAGAHGPGMDGVGPVAVDWAVIDALFPMDPDTGRLGFTPYAESGMGMGMGPPPEMGGPGMMGARRGSSIIGMPAGMDVGMGPLAMGWQQGQHP